MSVVVDDHDMGVTHIIRGVDHLTNAARQTQIYLAHGAGPVPEMTHVPLIHGPDGAKLSKRHGALGVEAVPRHGLPSGMPCATISPVSAGATATDEIFSTEQLVEWFTLDSLGKSASRFDFAKLENLNGHYIRHTPDAELLQHLLAFMPHAEGGPDLLARTDDAMKAKLLRAMPGLKERAKTLVELLKGAAFLYASRPLPMDDKARQILADGGQRRWPRFMPVLAGAATGRPMLWRRRSKPMPKRRA
jgi:glutamyl-tRNA synthetase